MQDMKNHKRHRVFIIQNESLFFSLIYFVVPLSRYQRREISRFSHNCYLIKMHLMNEKKEWMNEFAFFSARFLFYLANIPYRSMQFFYSSFLFQLGEKWIRNASDNSRPRIVFQYSFLVTFLLAEIPWGVVELGELIWFHEWIKIIIDKCCHFELEI